MADEARGDVFLLLPRVLLERGASIDGFNVGGLGLVVVNRLLEQVLTVGGGELTSIQIPPPLLLPPLKYG